MSAMEAGGSSSEAPLQDESIEPETKAPWHSYDTVFLNAKAGMSQVDKESVQKLVYEMSKGSRFYENEQRKEAQLQLRVQNFQEQAARLNASKLAEIKPVVDRKLAELEESRDISRVWMHVDLDAFYAAVEALDDPSLASKPMAVGGMSMICTANYEARKYGVRAAMPGFIGCKLCPDLIFIKPDFKKYSHYSDLTRQVFRLYDEHYIARSMDEAYLDITELCKNESSAQVAERLRKDVFDKTKLTCSAGVAANRLLAKVCSDINKPNGQYVLENDREKIMDFISALPVRKVSGIGKVTERLLKDVLGIKHCSDFLEQKYVISALFSPISRDFFLSIGLGIGGSETPQEEPRKSLSCERTFSPTSDEAALIKIIGDLAESLAEDMAKEDLKGRTLTLKLKSSNFEVRNRAFSTQHYFSSKEEIESYSIKLLKAELPLSLRLIGVRISQFKGHDRSQKTLEDFLKHSTDARSKELEPEPDDPDVLENDEIDSAENDENTGIDSASLPAAETLDDILENERLEPGKPENNHWNSEGRCSRCGVKISADFPWLRQEHEDFHFALTLQEQGEKRLNDSSPSGVKRICNARQEKSRKRLSGSKISTHSIQSYFTKSE